MSSRLPRWETDPRLSGRDDFGLHRPHSSADAAPSGRRAAAAAGGVGARSPSSTFRNAMETLRDVKAGLEQTSRQPPAPAGPAGWGAPQQQHWQQQAPGAYGGAPPPGSAQQQYWGVSSAFPYGPRTGPEASPATPQMAQLGGGGSSSARAGGQQYQSYGAAAPPQAMVGSAGGGGYMQQPGARGAGSSASSGFFHGHYPQ